MRGINRVFLMGRVDRAPVAMVREQGRVVDVGVVTTLAVRGADNSWGEEEQINPVRLTGQRADIALAKVQAGSSIAVEGSLRYDYWGDAGAHQMFVQAEGLHLLPGASAPWRV